MFSLDFAGSEVKRYTSEVQLCWYHGECLLSLPELAGSGFCYVQGHVVFVNEGSSVSRIITNELDGRSVSKV